MLLRLFTTLVSLVKILHISSLKLAIMVVFTTYKLAKCYKSGQDLLFCSWPKLKEMRARQLYLKELKKMIEKILIMQIKLKSMSHRDFCFWPKWKKRDWIWCHAWDNQRRRLNIGHNGVPHTGYQPMKDSYFWEMGNKWGESCNCPRLVPWKSFQALVQGKGTETGVGVMSRESWESRETKAVRHTG